MQKNVMVQHPPDVRVGNYESFLNALSSRYPVIFNIIPIHTIPYLQQWLQADFKLPPAECARIYGELAYYYHIRANDFTAQKLARRDHTLLQLHQQLWHEANAQDEQSFQPYRLL